MLFLMLPDWLECGIIPRSYSSDAEGSFIIIDSIWIDGSQGAHEAPKRQQFFDTELQCV